MVEAISRQRLEQLAKIKAVFPDWPEKNVGWLLELSDRLDQWNEESVIDVLSRAYQASGLDSDDYKSVVWEFLKDTRKRARDRAKKREGWDSPQMSLFHPEAFEN